jgi:transcriptional regulator with XRE-family HTH domain
MTRRITRLERFIRTHELKPAAVAREANVSRQHLLRLRNGVADPSIMLAMRIRDACGRLVSRTVGIAEVFEVD